MKWESSLQHSRWNRFHSWLIKPIDGASLAIFRLAFGGIMMWEVWRYFDYGWITKYYTGKQFYFSYFGFEWISPWPTEFLMKAHFVAIAVLGFLIAIGFLYRIAAPLIFVAFSYVFLLEQARYLNHFYLVVLIAFLLIFVPANAVWSVDSLLGKLRLPQRFSALFPTTNFVPNWSLWMLRMQIGVVYFYGGIAKLTPDWLQGKPLSDWVSEDTHIPIIGPYLAEPWMGLFLSYGGLLVDLFIVPILLWRRTRIFGYVIVLAFNLLNWQLFSIGIFPWFMMAASLLYFEANWPRRLLLFWRKSPQIPEETGLLFKRTTGKVFVYFLLIYTGFQLLFPFRHFLYPGVVHWTEEGHKFAWHMKLRSKAGDIRFRVYDPELRQTFTVDPNDYLTGRQHRKMSTRPDMILQFAHFLQKEYYKKGHAEVEVYADAQASLNGRPWQRLIDPHVNLAERKPSLFSADYIIPLHTKLP